MWGNQHGQEVALKLQPYVDLLAWQQVDPHRKICHRQWPLAHCKLCGFVMMLWGWGTRGRQGLNFLPQCLLWGLWCWECCHFPTTKPFPRPARPVFPAARVFSKTSQASLFQDQGTKQKSFPRLAKPAFSKTRGTQQKSCPGLAKPAFSKTRETLSSAKAFPKAKVN